MALIFSNSIAAGAYAAGVNSLPDFPDIHRPWIDTEDDFEDE